MQGARGVAAEGDDMQRALLIVMACLLLGGCWGSEERLFGPGDWARLDVDGEYSVETLDEDDDAPRIFRISSHPDGLIEIAPSAGRGRGAETLRLGLVRISGGSGDFYVAVDRTDPGKSEGDLYALAKVSGRSLAFFLPDCAGTPPIDGLEKLEGLAGEVCDFRTKEALLEAALLAERFLSEPHIVTVSPFTKFEKIDPDSGAELLEE
jgi:hypothetical protein